VKQKYTLSALHFVSFVRSSPLDRKAGIIYREV